VSSPDAAPLPPPAAQLPAAVDAILDAIGSVGVVGVYLYGSAVRGGLRPDSDLDLLVVTGRRLTSAARRALVDALRPISRRDRRPAGWRPLEVTVVTEPDLGRPGGLLQHALQYGEWLDDEALERQVAAEPTANPDLVVLLAMVRADGQALVGPDVAAVLPAVSRRDVELGMVAALPDLLADLRDDTRNVLLTLARMWSTAETARFRPKDEAADWAIGRLGPGEGRLLERARDLYRGGGWGRWEDDGRAVVALAGRMAAEVVRISESRGTR